MKLSSLRKTGDFEAEWWPVLDGSAEVLVRPISHPEVRRYMNRVKGRQLMQTGGMSDKLQRDMYLDMLANVGMEDWKGFEEDDGSEIPFSPENLRKAIKQVDWLLDEFLSAMTRASDFAKYSDWEVAEGLGKD